MTAGELEAETSAGLEALETMLEGDGLTAGLVAVSAGEVEAPEVGLAGAELTVEVLPGDVDLGPPAVVVVVVVAAPSELLDELDLGAARGAALKFTSGMFENRSLDEYNLSIASRSISPMYMPETIFS